MKYKLVICMAVLGLLAAAPAQAAVICDAPPGKPQRCIPASPHSYFARIQQAADYYYSAWRAKGHRASPAYAVTGASGAGNYSIPYYCTAAPPYLAFVYGVVVDDIAVPRTYVPGLGLWQGAPIIPGYGLTYAGVGQGRCRWVWGMDADGATARQQCAMGIHETGHVMGWSDPGHGDVDLPPIMHQGYAYQGGSLPLLDDACRAVGL